MASVSYHLLLTFSLFSLSKPSPLTPLFSLRCSEPSNQTLVHVQTIKTLLDNLTNEVTKTGRFTTSTIGYGHDRFTGLMQCRFGLDQPTCNHCIQSVKHTISALCPNSNAITAWSDGCYLQYCQTIVFLNNGKGNTNTNRFCSNRSIGSIELSQFEPALDTLLLRLRAEVNLVTHHGLSYGKLVYGNNITVYGLVECLRFLSPRECDACVNKAIDKLQEYCIGRNGGTVVAELCLARFESFQFYPYSGSGGSGGVTVWETAESGGMGYMVKVVWIGVVACLVVVVLCAWLLRRSVIDRAKVVTLNVTDDDKEMESEEID